MHFKMFLYSALLVAACQETPSWMPGSQDDEQGTPSRPSQSAPEVTDSSLPADPIYKAAITNLDYLKASVNLDPWLRRGHHGERLTIAILDNGFGGLKDVIGKQLPPDTKVEPSKLNNESPTPHGTKLAEIIFAMTSGSPRWTSESKHPRIKLYNSNGFTNFSAAVDQAISDKVDMIVYSQVWEFGGNFDGGGFINAAVNKATNAGILWINAAGNYASSSWQGSIQFRRDGTVLLPYQENYVRLVVNETATAVKITLAWNDFADTKDWRTSRDLDLVLLDSKKREIAASQLIQDGVDHGKDPKYSSHAREMISTNLQPGVYLLKVIARSRNFDGASRLRLAADGVNISFLDQSPFASVMIPADNPNVLTVGASDDDHSSAGPTMAGFTKPEIVAPSIIEVEGAFAFQGSSTAAAVAAATLAVYQEACGVKFTRRQLLDRIIDGRISQTSTKGLGLWLNEDSVCR
jgi:hypothetical protein